MPYIIKRGGKRPTEQFSLDKLHASVSAACLCVNTPEGEAQAFATSVCQLVSEWLTTRPEVTSDDLRRKAAEALSTFHQEAAYLYKNHRLVI